MMRVSPALKGTVMRTAAGTPSPTRREYRARQALWLSLGLGLVLAAGAHRGGAAGIPPRPLAYVLVTGGVALATALVGARWLLLRGGDRPPPARRSLLRVSVGVPSMLAFGAALGAVLTPELRSGQPVPALMHWMCLGLFFGLGAALLWIMFYRIPRLEPAAPRLMGASLGAVIGAWVSFAVSVQCPLCDPAHVVLAHMGPTLALIVAGVVLGERRLGLRFERRS